MMVKSNDTRHDCRRSLHPKESTHRGRTVSRSEGGFRLARSRRRILKTGSIIYKATTKKKKKKRKKDQHRRRKRKRGPQRVDDKQLFRSNQRSPGSHDLLQWRPHTSTRKWNRTQGRRKKERKIETEAKCFSTHR